MSKRQAPQKEAIFQIIKSVLGQGFREGMSVRDLLLPQNGHTRIETAEFKEIRERIYQSLLDGTISCKGAAVSTAVRDSSGSSPYMKTNPKFKLAHYANNILRYWLRNDPRLGGKPTRKLRPSHKGVERYLSALTSDDHLRQLSILKGSIEKVTGKPHDECEQLILKRKFSLFLYAINFSVENLPSEIKDDLLSFSDEEKRKAA